MCFQTVCLTPLAANEDSEAEWLSDRPKVTDLPWRKLGADLRTVVSPGCLLISRRHGQVSPSAHAFFLIFSWTFLVLFPSFFLSGPQPHSPLLIPTHMGLLAPERCYLGP